MVGRRLGPILVIATLIAGLAPAPADAALSPEAFEECLLEAINTDRATSGVGALQMASDINIDVRAFSAKIAAEGDLRHMTSTERNPILPDGTFTWGENVAWHSNPNLPDCSTIHSMFMGSSGHRANILSADKRFAAIGVFIGNNGTWVTELFFDSPAYTPPSGTGAFWDDDGSLFETAIEKIAAAGITTGCNPPTNDRYCPDDSLTRGEMAAFLVRALNLTNSNGTDYIDDNDSIFATDIQKLSAAGITKGCNPPTNNRYCPNDPLTRGEMAAFLVRALGL